MGKQTYEKSQRMTEEAMPDEYPDAFSIERSGGFECYKKLGDGTFENYHANLGTLPFEVNILTRGQLEQKTRGSYMPKLREMSVESFDETRDEILDRRGDDALKDRT